MKLTKEIIETHNPCQDGIDWYLEHGTDDLLTTLLLVNNHRPDWARWLFTRLMTRNQRIEIAIFSAEQLLHIYESKYPNDDRPRKSIEAAKAILNSDTVANRDAAAAAADAAYAAAADAAAAAAYAAAADAAAAAAYAAYAADAAAADAAAADAAAAAYAAYAADAYDAADAADAAAADAAAAAADAAKKELQELIINQAAIILERGDTG